MASLAYERPRSKQQTIPFSAHGIHTANAAHADCHGETAEEEQRRQLAEEQTWKANTIDLHRVMDLSKAMYLLLEHNNEALLRIAMEIVLDVQAAKVLWWEDGWYSDEVRREAFRKIVKEKLKVALGRGREGAAFQEEEDDNIVSKDEYNALKAKLAEMEGKFHAADRAKMVAENRCRELDESQSDAAEKIKAMEKTAEELRKRVREMEQEAGKPVEDLHSGKIAELEQKIKLLEVQRTDAQGKVKALEQQLATGAGLSVEAQKKLQEMEKQLKEQKEATEKAIKEAQRVKEQLERERNKSRPQTPQIPIQSKHEPQTIGKDKMDALLQKAEEQRRLATLAEQAAKQAQQELASARAEIDGLREQHKLDIENAAKEADARVWAAQQDADKFKQQFVSANSHISELSKTIDGLTEERNRLLAELNKPVPKAEPKPEAPRIVEAPKAPIIKGVPQEEVDKLMAELEKYKERNNRLRSDNNELKAANADLEEKNTRMLKMLHEIKEQLARMTEIAEKKGLGDAVKQILEESKVAQTLESAEYTCFNRLYDDAKRRMEKQRKIQEERLGIHDHGMAHRTMSSRFHHAQQPNGLPYGAGAPGFAGSSSRSLSPVREPSGATGGMFGGGGYGHPSAGAAESSFHADEYAGGGVSSGSHLAGEDYMSGAGFHGGMNKSASAAGMYASPSGSFSAQTAIHGGIQHGMASTFHGAPPHSLGSNFSDMDGIGDQPVSSTSWSSHGRHPLDIPRRPGPNDLFGRIDTDNTGTITREEFNAALASGALSLKSLGSVQLGRDRQAGASDLPLRREYSSFAIEGHNPARGPPPRLKIQENDFRIGRSPALSSSASAGALLPSPTSFASSASPVSLASNASAMAMDSRARERSLSNERYPPMQRRLIESSSAPKINAGDELPPLMVRQRFNMEASRTSPGGFGIGATSASRVHGLRRIPARTLIKDDDSSWRGSRTNVDDMLLGIQKIGDNPGGGSLAGFPTSNSNSTIAAM